MRWEGRSFTLVTVLAVLVTCASPLPTTDGPDTDAVTQRRSDSNVNHIFNTVHSSMRQWGSSWYHNGMSLFLATVPANTEFYHGTHAGREPVKGIEWLAFEPEHALTFANIGPPPRGRPHKPHNQSPLSNNLPEDTFEYFDNAQTVFRALDNDQQPPRRGPHFPSGPGYLHTYRTKHDLSLLYIDGLSAAKCNIGTLESQNQLLLGWDPERMPAGMMDEKERADGLCEMAKTNWKGKIHGFIRMELGFEIILCDFEQHLNFLDSIQTKALGAPSGKDLFNDIEFNWYHSIAARFNGIGADRVSLNYDDFVTAYDYDVDLFPDGLGSMPRLRNLSRADLAMMRSEVDRLVLSHDLPFHSTSIDTNWQTVADMIAARPSTQLTSVKSTNWQAIADLIVTRYSSVLPSFAEAKNLTILQHSIETLMRPFIDFATPRNHTAEIERCSHHFLPPSVPSSSSISPVRSPASHAISSISHRICSTLFTVLTLPNSTSITTLSMSTATSLLRDLVTYLDWSVWRRCPDRCAYDEVCFIPIWPLGTVYDREIGHGQCRNASAMIHNQGQSYWFLPGEEPRPPPRDGDDDRDEDVGV